MSSVQQRFVTRLTKYGLNTIIVIDNRVKYVHVVPFQVKNINMANLFDIAIYYFDQSEHIITNGSGFHIEEANDLMDDIYGDLIDVYAFSLGASPQVPQAQPKVRRR